MMIITIDGPVATGKSTLAKKLAQALNFVHFDTGAMYRSLTWKIIEDKVDLQDPKQLNAILDNFHFEIKLDSGLPRYYVNNIDVTEKIRDTDITAHVSEVSAMKEVRTRLVKIQQELSKGIDAVFEGRDMGSVVFPRAEVKFFLSGRPDIRALRRHKELMAKFPDKASYTLEDTLNDLKRRDHYDSTREHSPLIKASDAIEIDTSDLTPDGLIELMLKHVNKRLR